ncbi:hypothetical protein [Streptomyces sp. G-G2]|uniref:hypothetical protein n=1 Tax=Streptomyces sp. G-G2 TaxID=3046201 RepID=UPI0024BA150C|nr:hypothetical protein [Streptomyces sp. G-G2]MDJ0379869.1 hypothetical protein [Streptomyces sp. G-G2]
MSDAERPQPGAQPKPGPHPQPGPHPHPQPGPHPRPSHRTAWTVAAALSAVLVVVPASWQAWSQRATGSGSLNGGSGGRPVTALEIDAGDATVTVTPRADRDVVYRAHVRWSLDKPVIEESWAGGTLRLAPRCPGIGPGLDAGPGCMIDLGVSVPVDLPVTVVAASGKVGLSGLGGAVDVRMGSGPLRLTALRGPLRAAVDSGSLGATDLTSPEADIRTGSGSATARFVAPPARLTARAESGQVEVTVPVATRFRVTARVGAGRLDVDPALRDPAGPGLLDIATGSGRAVVRYP